MGQLRSFGGHLMTPNLNLLSTIDSASHKTYEKTNYMPQSYIYFESYVILIWKSFGDSKLGHYEVILGSLRGLGSKNVRSRCSSMHKLKNQTSIAQLILPKHPAQNQSHTTVEGPLPLFVMNMVYCFYKAYPDCDC